MNTQTKAWHATKTTVPLDWKRYRDRLRANGWDSTWSQPRLVDNIADEMLQQWFETHLWHLDDSDQQYWDIYELAEQAADELDGEW